MVTEAPLAPSGELGHVDDRGLHRRDIVGSHPLTGSFSPLVSLEGEHVQKCHIAKLRGLHLGRRNGESAGIHRAARDRMTLPIHRGTRQRNRQFLVLVGTRPCQCEVLTDADLNPIDADGQRNHGRRREAEFRAETYFSMK